MKTASGDVQRGECFRRLPRDDGDPMRQPECRRIAADVRGAIFARLEAVAVPPHSTHSTEIDPEPAPMSHSRSPGRGASAESASARSGRLVI